ncbi:MAG TPA: HD domain-containing phosphohydrolase [Nocardioides sp.]|nr:HD domain-containing phosphohydrolase [Nocardioides sp.]
MDAAAAVPGPSWPELLGAVSLACDRAMGLPLETGLATCVVATRLAHVAGLDAGERGRAYRLALLQHIGCTVENAELAEIVGDELLMRQHSSILDFTDQRAMFGFMLAHVARANPVLARPAALLRAMAGGKRILASAVDICEGAQLLGRRCGYAADELADLATVYENWDGTGVPAGVVGEDIPRPVQVVQVASLAVNAERLLGAGAAEALLTVRRGRTHAPGLVDAFLADPARWEPLRGTGSLWDAVIAAEPEPVPAPSQEDVDRALAALGDLADLKSPLLLGHSSGVADLAAAAARAYGLQTADVHLVRRAGWVHDVGRVAVSSRIWNARAPLRADDREQVRLHPYYTDQVLTRSSFLASLAEVASAHHERLDGSGYHRGTTGAALGVPARILAAADAYRTKTEERPHRPALSAADAATHLLTEAAEGRLDEPAVEAVLEAAGQAQRPTSTRLTPREIEILAVAARGSSMREIARELGISPKTVDGHLQRIYPKIGVSTRGGATVWVLEHGLLRHEPRVRPGENSP